MIQRFLAWLDDRSGLVTWTRHVARAPGPAADRLVVRLRQRHVHRLHAAGRDRHRARHGVRALERRAPTRASGSSPEQALLGRFLRGHALLRRLGDGGAGRRPCVPRLPDGRRTSSRASSTGSAARCSCCSRWRWRSPGSCCAGTRTRSGRSSSPRRRRAGCRSLGGDLARFILAGDTVGGATLSRFFAFHVFFIPALVFLLIGLHLCAGAQARHLRAAPGGRAGGPGHLPRPLRGAPATRGRALLARCRLARRGVRRRRRSPWSLLLALVVGPPALGKSARPERRSRPIPRPDWYFLWYFAVLALTPQHLETVVIVLGAAGLRRDPPAGAGLQHRRAQREAPALGRAGRAPHRDHIGTFWFAGRAGALVARFRRRNRSRPPRCATLRPEWSPARRCFTRRGASSATRSGGRGEAGSRPHAGRDPDVTSGDGRPDHQRGSEHAGLCVDPDPGRAGRDRRVSGYAEVGWEPLAISH